jgi:hypothetical protein
MDLKELVFMDTYFASPERTSDQDFAAEIDLVSRNAIVTGLLNSVNGLLAVLDENRQIIAINHAFLDMLGIDNPDKVLGLRPGEAVQCVHADDGPGGCGTGKICSTCGAAISIVSSLVDDSPVERICALTARKGENTLDLALNVRSQPIRVEDCRFILLFLQDITRQQKRAALERAFFHDVNNMLGLLAGSSEMLCYETSSDLALAIHQTSLRIIGEIAIQQSLALSESFTYKPVWHTYTVGQIINDLQAFFISRPKHGTKSIEYPSENLSLSVRTDIALVLRVLCNMVTNALEAAKDNERIKVSLDHTENTLSFSVWNQQAIPEKILLRIFQRNFSTKSGDGRGVGTYSMKLFGEQVLGGKVTCKSSPERGTLFTLSLPR